MTLTDFLLARIAEDEEEARGAAEEVGAANWYVTEVPHEGAWFTKPGGYLPRDEGGGWATDHATRWSPARVLAECEAKRRIVDSCAVMLVAIDDWEYDDAPNLADRVLRLLALPYAEHEDYRDEWKP